MGVLVGALRPVTGRLRGLNTIGDGWVLLDEGLSRGMSLRGILRGINTMGDGGVAVDAEDPVRTRVGMGMGEVEMVRVGLGQGLSRGTS